MAETQLEILDGPDKPGLLWALAYPETQHVTFEVPDGPLNARIDVMEEQADGFTYRLSGIVTSGALSGRPFTGAFHFGSRSGHLSIAN